MEADKPKFEKRVLADGRAVVYCGDSLELLKAGLLKCDAIVSDPPYGIGFQHGGGGRGLSCGSRTEKIIGDDRPFDPSPWVDAAKEKPVVLFGADHYKTRLPDGGRFLVWDKSCGGGLPLSSSTRSSRGRTGATRAASCDIFGWAPPGAAPGLRQKRSGCTSARSRSKSWRGVSSTRGSA
jgi:hypothetical protein